jgi:hypothetical protein
LPMIVRPQIAAGQLRERPEARSAWVARQNLDVSQGAVS